MGKPFKDDMQIVQLYLNGDHKTEKRLYIELKKLISNLIKFMEGKGLTFVDKENIIAEIIFQIMVAENHKVLRSYLGQSKLSSYLWPVVRNKIIDAFRKETRYHSEVACKEPSEDSFSDQNGTIEVIIEEHIASMPPVEKFIKIAKWIEGLNYQQIINNAKQKFSDEVTLNSQRIAYVLHTNRKDLQKKLKKYRA